MLEATPVLALRAHSSASSWRVSKRVDAVEPPGPDSVTGGQGGGSQSGKDEAPLGPQGRERPALLPQLAAPVGRDDRLNPENRLGLERHGGRVPAGLWARGVQRLSALNAMCEELQRATVVVDPYA
jgi:hypothetical protein